MIVSFTNTIKSVNLTEAWGKLFYYIRIFNKDLIMTRRKIVQVPLNFLITKQRQNHADSQTVLT